MNGKELLLAFAGINESQIAEAADTAAARQVFLRYKARRNKMIGMALCCAAVVLSAVGFVYRGLPKKVPAVLPIETTDAGQFTKSRPDIVPTTTAPDVDTTITPAVTPAASSTKPTKTEASSSVPAATKPAPVPGSRSNPETTENRNADEPINTQVSPTTGQTTTDRAASSTQTMPTTVPPTTAPTTTQTPTATVPMTTINPTSVSPTIVLPTVALTTDEETGAQPSVIVPDASLLPTDIPTSEKPSSTVPVAVPSTTEPFLVKQYVYSVSAPEYASYLSGKVIDGSRVGARIGDATASAGWRYADGSMPVIETLRCELFEIKGIDRSVAVCVRFIDKGEALTTDHYYALCNPNAGLSSVSEFLIPTTLPNNEE